MCKIFFVLGAKRISSRGRLQVYEAPPIAQAENATPLIGRGWVPCVSPTLSGDVRRSFENETKKRFLVPTWAEFFIIFEPRVSP